MDGHKTYLDGKEMPSEAKFGRDAMLQKILRYFESNREALQPCAACRLRHDGRQPRPPIQKHASASLEGYPDSRQQLTRLTDVFSKKAKNLRAAMALHFIRYNFAQIHKTLQTTPAMAAGLSDHVWNDGEIAALAG